MIRRRLLPIEILVFVVGAASLGGEIAATRLLAPWFGESTIVWANTIATVLVALSVGYAVGGRIADRRPDPGILDRKSTRLNSSHVATSYAVFCLQKKTFT